MAISNPYADLAKSFLTNPDFLPAVQSAQYVQMTGQSDFDSNGSIVIATKSNTFKGFFVGYSAQQQTMDGFKDGDVKCLIPASSISFVPKVSDSVLWKTVTYKVLKADVDPTGSALYTLQLRAQ